MEQTTGLTRRQFASLALTLGVAPFSDSRRQGAQIPSAVPDAVRQPDDSFLATLPTLMEVTQVPGVAMGVVQGGKLTWQRYAGVADLTTGRPLDAQSLLPAASLGKPVFSLAVLHLADEGKLDLDRPLRSYVPDHAPSDPRGDKVTARHVLSHSSGYRNWRNNPDQALVPAFEPGTAFQYSGEGFYYLQRVVETLTHVGLEQFMETRLFGPLGMASSTYAWRDDTEARLTMGHSSGKPARAQSRDLANRLFQYAQQQGKPLASFTYADVVAALGALRPAPPPLPIFLLPNVAATLLTTVGDYATFVSRVLAPVSDSTSLQAATRQQMLSPQVTINRALTWGLGWGIERAGGHDYIWHWGDNGTYKNFVLAHVLSRSAVVVFTNGNNGMRIAEAVVRAASGRDHLSFDWL